MKRMLQVCLTLGVAVTLVWGEQALSEPDSLSVESLAELEEAFVQVRGKPTLVRVRADWSVSDMELDKELASACLRQALSDIAWIDWDVTDNTDADRQFLAKYDVFGPPTFLLFSTSGDHLQGRDVVGHLPAKEMVATLTEAFELATQSEYADCLAAEGAVATQSWNELVADSYAYLNDRQKALEADFGLGEHDRWDIDQDKGTLTLSVGDAPVVEAKIAIVGTLISAQGVWRWSWANPSVDPKLSAPIDLVRQYGAENGLEKLTDRGWRAEEIDAWEMAAISNYLLQGKGVYGAPAGDLGVFVVITEIRKTE